MSRAKFNAFRVSPATRIIGAFVLTLFGGNVSQSASPTAPDASSTRLSIPERVKAVRERIMAGAKDGGRSPDARSHLVQFFNFPNFHNHNP